MADEQSAGGNTQSTEAATTEAAAPTSALLADPAPQTASANGKAKPADAAGAEPEAKPDPAQAVPEKYEFAKISDLDIGDLSDFESAAKEAKLSNESANKLLASAVGKTEAAFKARFEATRESWKAALTADPEFAKGDGFDANLAIAKQGFLQFAPEGLADVVNASGLGDNPAFVKFCLRVGQKIAEDKVVPGGDGTPVPTLTLEERAAKSLYGGSK